MPDPRKSALIVANLHKDDAESVAVESCEFLRAQDWDVEVFRFPGNPGSPPSFEGFNLVVSIGGDGTLLYAGRFAAPLGIPVLPINLGRLGFIAANRRESWKEMFLRWNSGISCVSERMMLAIEIFSGGDRKGRFLSLNDGVVSSQGISKMIGLGLSAGGQCFGQYRADGLIVSTPTGSTAYNLAAGGPAVHPEMDAIVVNPICPFTLASRPLVLPGSEILDVTILETRRSGAMLTVDGQETLMLGVGDIVRFMSASEHARLIVPPELVFYGSLKTKLGWTGDRDA
ncbi:MAG: NAD(+)/NADH kinase [Rectinemataceae bacterium]